jgi:hypothetical protein
MDYGKLFTKAWRYFWRYKILWLFGILNRCQTFSINVSDNSAASQIAIARFERWASDPVVGIAIALFGLSIFLLMLILSPIGQMGIIRVMTLAETGEEEMTWERIFADGWGIFWRLLALSLLIGFIAAIAWIVLFGAPFIALAALIISGAGVSNASDVGFAIFGAFILVFLFSLCIFLPVSFLLTPFLQMSRIALVNERTGLWNALRNGWRMYRKHFGALLLLTVISLALRFFLVLLAVLVAVMFVLGIPLWLQLLLFLFGFLLFGWFSAFGESLWALAYLDLRPQAARAGEGISTATG